MKYAVSIAVAILFIGISNSSPFLVPDMTVTKIVQQTETSESVPADEEKLFSSEDVRSTKEAFLFSLALPGAGEFYSKSYIKAGAFFAAEAAFWSGFLYFMHEYSIKEDDFKAYADSHWDKNIWLLWYDSLHVYGELVDTSVHDAIVITDSLGIEMLPTTKTQQYYEMIGKYDWSVLGWDDIIERDDYVVHVQATYATAANNPGNPSEIHDQVTAYLGDHVHSENMDYYMDMRSDANKQYTVAKYFIGAAILNHVLSAFDAAWTAKRHNDKLYRGFSGIESIEVKPIVAMEYGKPAPKILCTILW